MHAFQHSLPLAAPKVGIIHTTCKRALGMVDRQLKVVVESEAEANNLEKLAHFRKLGFRHEKNGYSGFTVTLTKAQG